MTQDFNDSLDDLLGGPIVGPAKPRPAAATYQPKSFTEGCAKCRGTGRFISYAGRDCGPCFSCKGQGSKTFAAPAADRARARELSADRKARKLAEARAEFEAENPAIVAWIAAEADRPNPFAFAIAMREALATYGALTDGQLAACQRLVDRAAARKAERAQIVAEAPAVDASRIEQAFAVARAKAQRPGQMGIMVKPLSLQSGDMAIEFRPGSVGSQWEGMLFAKAKASGKKLGSIQNGRFVRKFDCTAIEAEAVLDCASNPEASLMAYAKAWSRCGICNRGLLNDVSIARGIGPICAEKFGFVLG